MPSNAPAAPSPLPFSGRLTALPARLVATPARLWLFVLVVYLAASCFSVTVKRFQPLPGDIAIPFKRHAFIILSPPRVLRGEEPHFLMMAHSLAHDGDLTLSREYTHSMQGGPERGVYWTGRPAEYFLQHFAREPNFALVGTHPPGLPTFLAMLLWPWAGTLWMEPGAIWITAFIGALGVLVFVRMLESLGFSWPTTRNTALALAFATPWFSYSRTLYTEIYLGAGFLVIYLAMLRGRWWWAMPVCAALAWFKYPGLLLFAAMGTGALASCWKLRPKVAAASRRWTDRNVCPTCYAVFFAYAAAGAAVFLAIFFYNRAMYADTSWITNGPHTRPTSLVRAAAPIAWIPGDIFNNIKRLFTDYDKGLFPHCPILLFALVGLWQMAKDPARRRAVVLLAACAVPFTLLHLCYRYLMVGESYTTRYLVPMVPLALVGLPAFWRWSSARPVWRTAGIIALALSFLNNIIAGFLPALAFDKSPWEVWFGAARALATAVLFFREHTGSWAL